MEADEASDTTTVYIYDEIGFWGTDASTFVNQLKDIKSKNIDLRLNSPGGEIFDGIAIYNALKMHPANVTVYVDALAASAASFIAQAGDKIVMTRPATMMIHDGIGLVYGNSKDMYDTGDLLDKLSNTVADIYDLRAGGGQETWRNLMREETWYNAQEAVAAGLADEVLEEESDAPENKFDLMRVFNYSGREEAPSPETVRLRVFNRVKEARMATRSTPQNDNSAGQDNPAGDDTQNPAAPAAPAAPESPVEADDVQPVEPPTGDEPAQQPPAAPTNSTSGNGATVTFAAASSFTFMVNGTPVTDFAAVQNHINVLESAAKETKETNRKQFVKNLATTNRIAATQLQATEEFALKLSDELWDSWVASWDAAPSVPLLSDHSAGGYGSDQTPGAAKANNDQLETAKAIVNRHKIGGMPEDQIKLTASYQKVIQADPEFKL